MSRREPSAVTPAARPWSPARTALIYLAVAAFAGFFSAVYLHFSHGVSSAWMVTLAAWPLAGGALPGAVFALAPRLRRPAPGPRLVYRLGLATLAAGACLKGVFAIYGTSSDLLWPYAVAGPALVLAATLWHRLADGPAA
jgi:hypothetical protein